MRSHPARVGVIIAVVAAAVVLFIVLSGGDDDNGGDDATVASTATGTATGTTSGTATAPAAPDVIVVKDGKPVGGVQRLTYDRGDQVRLEVQLDQPAEEVHVHGYEIEEPAESSPVRVSFPAEIDGLFEIEVHGDSGEFQIAELRENP